MVEKHLVTSTMRIHSLRRGGATHCDILVAGVPIHDHVQAPPSEGEYMLAKHHQLVARPP